VLLKQGLSFLGERLTTISAEAAFKAQINTENRRIRAEKMRFCAIVRLPRALRYGRRMKKKKKKKDE